MKRFVIATILILLVLNTGVFADDSNSNTFSKDIIKINDACIFLYTSYTNYHIYCQIGSIVDLYMQPGEEFVDIGCADTLRWNVDKYICGSGNKQQLHILIKPAIDDPALTTNFIIFTNLHSYNINASISKEKYTPMVAWTYPQEEKDIMFKAQQEQQAQADESILPVSINMANVNMNYRIYHQFLFLESKPKYKWTPELCFDDGNKTYIKMPEALKTGDAPVLFVLDGNNLALVNYRVRKNYYIVDQLFDIAEMRNGKQKLTIKKGK